MKKVFYLFLFLLVYFNQLFAQTVLPNRMFADTVNAPFYYGVSSGDPTNNSVVIWTCITPSPDSFSIQVVWQVSSDMRFSDILQSGIYRTDTSFNFTVKIDVGGLEAGAVYYYRFIDNSGKVSAWGRTKTLPNAPITQTKIAVLSCSSIYSGYFNAYKRLSERTDLQVVLHLGDYIYDYVDADEQIRVPIPYPIEPISRADWVERYRYYLLDPDLREARRMQTWVTIWDNHDLNGLDTIPMQAYKEWLPIRETPAVEQNILYRSFSIGDLVDIHIADVNSRQGIDTFLDGETNMLDNNQFEWLTGGLKSSATTWHIIGSQKMAGGWYTNGISPALLDLVPNDSNVFDANSWDGFMETRNHLFDTIVERQVDNCMIVSGDAHITMAMDLVKHPHDSLAYDPITGVGAVGTEFLPSSISRGNFDEGGLAAESSPFIIDLSMKANPHHLLTEINSHGYGILEINQDSIRATPFYSDILRLTDTEKAGQEMVMLKGENHWRRKLITTVEDILPISIEIIPNPANQVFFIQLNGPLNLPITAYLSNLLGEQVMSFLIKESQEVPTSNLAGGTYVLNLNIGGNIVARHKIVLIH